jgi:hypothetical protein
MGSRLVHGKRRAAYVGPYTIFHEPDCAVFVAQCSVDVYDPEHSGLHPISSQGTTIAEAREALDSAVTMFLKHWPPRREA